ncbi:hypothetical protein D3C87_1161300 [compost metagenome]
MQRRRNHRGGRVGAHAAGVGAGIGVQQALVVLAGGQGEHVLAIHQHDEAGFLAFQEFLDDHARAGIAELVVGQHHVDGVVRFFQRHRHDHTLAGGQAIGLDHDRGALGVDVGVRGGRIGKRLVGSRGDVVAMHERLGEVLGGLQLRGSLGRPEDAQATGAEHVDDAGGQRGLGADHGERHPFALHEGGEHLGIGQRHVLQALVERRAAVARRHVHHLHLGGLGHFPRQRVLTSARTDNQYFHDPLPEKKRMRKAAAGRGRAAAMGRGGGLSPRSPRW